MGDVGVRVVACVLLLNDERGRREIGLLCGICLGRRRDDLCQEGGGLGAQARVVVGHCLDQGRSRGQADPQQSTGGRVADGVIGALQRRDQGGDGHGRTPPNLAQRLGGGHAHEVVGSVGQGHDQRGNGGGGADPPQRSGGLTTDLLVLVFEHFDELRDGIPAE